MVKYRNIIDIKNGKIFLKDLKIATAIILCVVFIAAAVFTAFYIQSGNNAGGSNISNSSDYSSYFQSDVSSDTSTEVSVDDTSSLTSSSVSSVISSTWSDPFYGWTPPTPSEPIESEAPFESVDPDVMVTVAGTEYSVATKQIDLSDIIVDDFDTLVTELQSVTWLREVDLYNVELDSAQRKSLIAALPNVKFNWIVEFDGVNYDSKTTDSIDFNRKNITAKTEELFEKLALLQRVRKVDMCGCGYTNAGMEKFVAAFPRIKFVWEITMTAKDNGRTLNWTLRTDAVAFSTLQGNEVIRLSSAQAQQLKYCTDLVALDLGHNGVKDLSFLKYLPNLKILILVDNWESGSLLTDVSMLRYCPKLEYLELFCNSISDLSVIKYLPNLKDLNVSWTPVADYNFFKNMPKIERFFVMNTCISDGDVQKLKEMYPAAQIERYGKDSIDHNWREHPRYYAMKYMFSNNKLHPLFS